MHKKIYMYATLPQKGKTPFGGGEVGNVRTIRMLSEAGYKVVTMRQRTAKAEWGSLWKIVSYPFRLLAGWSDVICKMLFASRNSLAHLSGFAGVTIWNEYVIMHIMKLLGFRVVYELRGGGAIEFWEKGSVSYRKMFSYLLNCACYVFLQGKENILFVKSISKTPVYYYPNCVENGFAPESIPIKPKDRINLLFYGRCEENKHVDMIIDVASIIQSKLPNVHLIIVGNGQASYIDMLKQKLNKQLKHNSYLLRPGVKHEELPYLLKDKHFYIFPSTQPREGQSNSVTECMSYGVIPIASPQGFNRSTIGDDNLIVDEQTSDAYADRIISIIQRGELGKLSIQVYARFQLNYSEEIVFKRTLKVYNEIVKGYYERK